MKSFESEIKKHAEKTRLKAVEREMVRDRILSYMEYHPLKKERKSEALSSVLTNRDFIYIPLNSLRVRLVGVAFSLLLIVGVPLLAERAVPGDVLYLVKTGVNESIRTQLASSPYEKVELETQFMERRIAEARLLASEGKLTEEVEAQIAQTVKVHANAVQDGLAEIRENDADGAALAEIVFNSALEVQSAVLNHEETASSSSVASLLDMVNTVRDEVAAEGSPIAPSYDGLIARIESETTRAYELFESVKKSATPEEIADIERRFSDIDRSIVHARELKEEDETGAVVEMMEVLGLVQKLISFLTDIDVRESVALETLVPVILTLEERVAQVTKTLDAVKVLVQGIEIRLPLVVDDGVREKIAFGLEDVTALMLVSEEALTATEIRAAEEKSTEAHAIAEDLSKLTENIPMPVSEDETTPVLPQVTPTTSPTTSLPTVIDVPEEVVETEGSTTPDEVME